MGRLSDKLRNRILAPASPTGLAVFRIAVASVLLCEAAEMYRLRDLVFDTIPGVQPSLVHHGPMIVAWLVAIVALLAGWKTRIAAVVNYVMCVATLGSFTVHEYHADYVYLPISLLLILAPVGERLSVDAWLDARAGRPSAASVPRFYYDAFVLLGAAIPYFDSVFFKLSSPMWLSGLGLWLPASLPQIAWHDVTFLLEPEWLARSLGYAALAFEGLFIFLMWVNWLRPWLAAIGVLFHLGIGFIFPIPWFGLLMATIYTLLFPSAWWDAIGRYAARCTRAFIVYSRQGLRLPTAPWTAPRMPSAAAALGPRIDAALLATCGVVSLIAVVQLNIMTQSPYANDIRRFYGFEVEPPAEPKTPPPLRQFARAAFGAVPHGVFQDFHFNRYEHQIAVLYIDTEGQEHWLPLTLPSGAPGEYNRGRQWARWTWRACGPTINPRLLAAGIRDYTAHYAAENGIDLDNTAFRILVKRVEVPSRWEPGLYRRQCKHDWNYAGYALWLRGDFQIEIRDIEAMNASPLQTNPTASPAVAAAR